MDFHHGHAAWIIAFIIILILAIIYTGYSFLTPLKSSHTTSTSGTTTSKTTTTVTVLSTINYSNSVSPCANFYIIGQQNNYTYTTNCNSTGGTLGLWVAAGNSGKEHVKIVGADGRTYVNQSSTYNCTTFFQNFTGPAQLYLITFTTGLGGGSCGNSKITINTTTTPPPKVVYKYIYNGNFGNGQYTGWNLTNPGFGSLPLNITASTKNSSICYQGAPWSNYNGTYFATTYHCGASVSPGNITSSPFLVNPAKPFLNFKIISPEDSDLYVELLRVNYKVQGGQQVYSNSTPVVIAHFNTFNLSRSINSSSTFANVSIPLTQYINQQLQIKVVAITEKFKNYIAVGDFALSNRPNQDLGVAINITNTGS